MHNVIRRKKRNKINYASRISMDVVVMGSGYFLSAIDFVPWYMKRKAIGEISLLWQELNMAYIYKFIICRYIALYINTHSKLSFFHQMCILLIVKCMTKTSIYINFISLSKSWIYNVNSEERLGHRKCVCMHNIIK